MSIEERRKHEEKRAFNSKLDEMLFRIRNIYPNGDMRKHLRKKRDRELKYERKKVEARNFR